MVKKHAAAGTENEGGCLKMRLDSFPGRMFFVNAIQCTNSTTEEG